MRLSVVIPTRDRLPSLSRVISALTAQRGDVSGGVEIVVVDDGSTDGTAVFLESAEDLVVLKQAGSGPATARNRGASAASGELLLFLGDDTVPEPGFLAAHERAHREAGPLPRAVLGYTGWDRERMRVTPFLTYLNEYGPQFGYSIIPDSEDVPFNFFYTSNVSLPRAFFLALGGFDEGFASAAWEDVELAYRATRVNPGPLRIVYRREARTRHEHPTTVESSRRRLERCGREAAAFARRYPELAEWLGAEKAEALRGARPFRIAVAERVIRMVDAVGLLLPGRVYEAVLRWDYLSGLKAGLSGPRDRAEAGGLHHRG